jgi:dipeptidyl aminopeptidase/acylaminoacyl peptidase
VGRFGPAVVFPQGGAAHGGAHRFLPNGTGLVYSPYSQSPDLRLFDLVTKKTRPLTQLSDHGAIRAFDITPDGKEIVFDRFRDNSDIVLIERPK